MARRVTRIEIEGLFGRLKYDLSAPTPEAGADVMILYGDNGSGKTTVLRLIYHLLSPEENKGHRTFLANVPFASVCVWLDDGTLVRAYRDGDKILGSYRIEGRPGNPAMPVRANIHAVERMGGEYVVKLEENEVLANSVEPFIRGLDIAVFILGDDRVLRSDAFARKRLMGLPRHRVRAERRAAFQNMDDEGVDARDIAVTLAVERMEHWMRIQALRAAGEGDESVHNLYAKIVRDLSAPVGPDSRTAVDVVGKTTESLEEVQARSQAFVEVGLVQPFGTRAIAMAVRDTGPGTVVLASQIIRSYVDSMRERLNALETTRSLLAQYVDALNRFFVGKRVKVHVRGGVTIVDDAGTLLRPDQLSSGEKQLLLLLSSTLTARETASIFLIDEPEISLNIKWQRRLIETLLSLTRGSETQMVLATHSLELLTPYGNRVVSLGLA